MGEAGLVRAEGTVATTIASNDLITFQKVSNTPSGQPEPREITYGNLITGGGTGLASTTVPYINSSGDFASDSANFFYTVGTGVLTATKVSVGQSGIAGVLTVWPSTASTGNIRFVAASNSGNTSMTITNASQAGTRTYTIPDAGVSASFLMTQGAQTIVGTNTFSGNIIANGTFTSNTGAVMGGVTQINDLTVGTSGTIGVFQVFPAAASNGLFAISAVNNTGNFNTTLSNANIGQSTVYTLPDPASATTNIVIDKSAQTIGGAKTFSSNIIPTGGIAAAGGFSASPRGIHTNQHGAFATTDGTNVTASTTTTYIAEIFVPSNMTITGIALFNGTAVAGNVTVGLADSTGAPISAAKSASTAQSGTTAYQLIPFSSPYAAVGPATYYIQVQFNSGSANFRAHVLGTIVATTQTGQTYGTFTSFTPGTTFTTNVGPIAGLY